MILENLVGYCGGHEVCATEGETIAQKHVDKIGMDSPSWVQFPRASPIKSSPR